MINKIHPAAAIIATLCIATFFTSTILVELIGSHESIAIVKSLIVMPGLFILVPAIASAGGTGFALAKNRKGRLVDSKMRRMPFIAANGLLILLPAALFLDQWAASGLFNTKFYIVQGLELTAGAVNLTLMSLNIRDGLKMTGNIFFKKKT
ncbi:MAG: hypothetical protein KAI17_03160 [Thiotrichaceae bacterium]|nr:hypothetical protein [Thiotrichaceae bacterium]